MSTTSIGVCLFDDPRAPRGGFASLDGAEPSYIAGYHELSASAVWVTNLEFPIFKEMNLLRLRHLAQSQYFRTSIKLLLAEYGLNDSKAGCQFLSRLFSRTAKLGHAHFGADPSQNNYRYHQVLADRIHIPGMTEPTQGFDHHAVQLVIDNATQENQAMAGVKKPERSKPVSFCFPRDAYGQWLFGRQYPISSAWKNDRLGREFTIGTRDGRKIQLTDSFIKKCGDYFSKNNRATFFRIAVVSHEASHRAFASFGAGSRDPRVWVCWPELLELLEYSVVTVYESMSTAGGLIRDYLPEYCNASGYGISEGLLFENLFVALASPVNRRNTALGAYMRAYDRAACGRAAASFHNAGFVVGSYGSGRVVLLLTDGQLERASEISLGQGLMPPLAETVTDAEL